MSNSIGTTPVLGYVLEGVLEGNRAPVVVCNKIRFTGPGGPGGMTF